MNAKLKTLTKSLIVAGVIGAVSAPVAAKKYRDYQQHNNSAYDYAKVVQVNPVVETYQVNKPVEHCWDEQVRVRSRHSKGHYTRTPEILGGILGAVIGNQVGDGRGKKVATVAGAVLGASVGRDVKHQNRRNRDHYDNRGHASYKTVRQCELKDSYTTEEQVVGYDVAYKYRGNVFNTQMDQHPGSKIKVKVTVDPV